MGRVAPRQVLRDPPLARPDMHAGLWLDRYLEVGTDEEEAAAKARHLKGLCDLPPPRGYPEAFEGRRRGLEASGALIALARSRGRLVVGLGQKGPTEAGLHLDHTWGVPLLPGPALKGLCARAAHELLADPAWRRAGSDGKAGERYAELFGETDHTGAVTFHDAWWDPRQQRRLPLHLDVMTVHHRDYYADGRADPTDMDQPVPVPFLAVSGDYLVAVEGDPVHCDVAMRLLQIGLQELGIGAKTNAGYGRLQLQYVSAAERAAAERGREEEMVEQALANLRRNTARDLVPQQLQRLAGPLRRRFAQEAVRKLGQAWLKDRPWAAELLRAAEGDP